MCWIELHLALAFVSMCVCMFVFDFACVFVFDAVEHSNVGKALREQGIKDHTYSYSQDLRPATSISAH